MQNLNQNVDQICSYISSKDVNIYITSQQNGNITKKESKKELIKARHKYKVEVPQKTTSVQIENAIFKAQKRTCKEAKQKNAMWS